MSYTWLPKQWLFKIWNLWLPFFATGIRITKVSPDYRQLLVTLKLRWWNRNYVGTQYGGSMFSMTDPFYMVMLLQNLGKDYIVWDKSASIRYLKPGKTDVTAEFILTTETINQIKNTLAAQNKMDWSTKIQIKDTQQQIVAEVEKTLYIRKKNI